MNIKEKIQDVLNAMNDAYMTVLANAEEIEESVDKVFEVEEFIENNGIYVAGFDAMDISYDLRYGFLENDIDIAYMLTLLDELTDELEDNEEYEELCYTLNDVYTNLHPQVAEVKDIYDYINILTMQIDTVKEELSKL